MKETLALARQPVAPYAVFGALSALSFVIALPTLPLPGFAGFWLAVVVWGLALTGASQVALPARAVPTLIASVAIFIGLAILAARWRPEQAAVLSIAATVLVFGVLNSDARWLRALLIGIALGGLLNVPIAMLQVLAPQVSLPGVTSLSFHGRAGGNLGQPNLLASLSLLALLSLMALRPQSGVRRGWGVGSAALGLCIAFTQSRTGLLGLLLVGAWAAADRRMAKSARWMAAAAVGACLLGMAWLTVGPQLPGRPSVLHRQLGLAGDISASRFAIWSDSLALLQAHTWSGVGWGQYSAAWSMSAFPERHAIPLDHAHNLPLHFAVELGLPLALIIIGIVAWVLWVARRALSQRVHGQAGLAGCLAMMLAVLGLHSLLEYPLWYANFLLPACFILGVLLRFATAGYADVSTMAASPIGASILLKLCGVAVVLGALFAAWDYARVLQAFKPFGPGLRKPLELRVAEGRRSVLFGHLVEYGLVTSASNFEGLQSAFERPRHRLVNPKLLQAYALALHQWGESDKARYVAQRLREFRDPRFVDFFAPCSLSGRGGQVPFQCNPPPSGIGYEDVR